MVGRTTPWPFIDRPLNIAALTCTVEPATTLAGPCTRIPGIEGTNSAGSAGVVSPIISATDGPVAPACARRARKASVLV
ncbi:MAG TPA: hypothetical protein VKP69_24255 [Isosphaeraceae bacterium]|nr:hypothetical protein [Isosphaeraceae bacterium]